jgi:hypothetical protein
MIGAVLYKMFGDARTYERRVGIFRVCQESTGSFLLTSNDGLGNSPRRYHHDWLLDSDQNKISSVLCWMRTLACVHTLHSCVCRCTHN